MRSRMEVLCCSISRLMLLKLDLGIVEGLLSLLDLPAVFGEFVGEALKQFFLGSNGRSGVVGFIGEGGASCSNWASWSAICRKLLIGVFLALPGGLDGGPGSGPVVLAALLLLGEGIEFVPEGIQGELFFGELGGDALELLPGVGLVGLVGLSCWWRVWYSWRA